MPELNVVMYHYVRDLPRSRAPRIKGMLIDEFREQLQYLCAEFEMATLEASIAFLRGEYTPRRDLCMLTFDDGLKEHFTEVMPLLAERRVQGLFGIITGCIEEQVVAPVHMNHFLTALVDFDEYQASVLREVGALAPGLLQTLAVDDEVATRSYPLDTPPMARFKLLVNFLLPAGVRDEAIRRVFARHCGPEEEFARELYMSWNEVRGLQSAGMLIAGHTHRHRPLATLNSAELEQDIGSSRRLMDRHLRPQELWPFSYPYGKRNSYSEEVIQRVRLAGFDCAFGTECGRNLPHTPLFELFRTDCKNAVAELQQSAAAAQNRQ